jgi:hypothetical protein
MEERKVRKVIEGFLEALGRPLEPWAVGYLVKGEWCGEWRADTGRDRMIITLERGGKFGLPVPPGIPNFTIEKRSEGGRGVPFRDWGVTYIVHYTEPVVEVRNLYLEAKDERAFFMARGESGALSETLALVRGLSPLFQALGLGDLEEALLTLGDLVTGAKAHGAYVLVSDAERGVLALRRGSLFGDPGLDKAFLLGEEVVLPYPEGEVALLGGVSAANSLVVSGFRVRWWDEVFPQDGGLLPVEVERHVLSFDPLIPPLLQEAARAALEEKPPPPLALKELLREMAISEDPMKRLRDEEFLREFKLRLLSRL